MSSNDSDQQTKHTRRGSITDFFTKPVYGSTGSANAQQARRMSFNGGNAPLTSPTGTTSGFLSAFAARRGSVSSMSAMSSSEEDATTSSSSESGSPPRAGGSFSSGSPFARRMSFGAKAMMDVKTGRQVPKAPQPTSQSTQPTSTPQRTESMPLPADSMPKQPILPTKPNRPDAMQERMLKGDFYMD